MLHGTHERTERNLNTTMIYTHALNKGGPGVCAAMRTRCERGPDLNCAERDMQNGICRTDGLANTSKFGINCHNAIYQMMRDTRRKQVTDSIGLCGRKLLA
jgi:hypothetical protein